MPRHSSWMHCCVYCATILQLLVSSTSSSFANAFSVPYLLLSQQQLKSNHHQQQQQQPLVRHIVVDDRCVSVKYSARGNSDNPVEEDESKVNIADNTMKKTKQPRPSPTGFSYVEEGVYTNIEEEIEAMGGDSSFLIPETTDTIGRTRTSTTSTTTQIITDDDTEKDVWEWDGVEDNDAYFDE